MTYEVLINGKTYRVELQRGNGERAWQCRVNGREMELDVASPERDALTVLRGQESFDVRRERVTGSEDQMLIYLRSARFAAELRDPRALRSRRGMATHEGGPKKLTAPMPGKVIRILAPAGTAVQPGQGVVVIEAMKMQNELKSPKAGTVQKVLAAEGAAVNAGDVLAVIE